MRLFGRSLAARRAKENHPEPERTHAGNNRGSSPQQDQTKRQLLPTCDIFAHADETRGSDLFRSHVCSSPLLSPPLLLSPTSSPLALSLSQRWTEGVVSLPGIPAEHPTARRASWKKPCGCWEAGCGSDGRWREGQRSEGWGEGEEAGITEG
ncbi:hypothetical protein Q8A73_008675 [Channa argus]|nr:hypothetical protein Q8A73_008675 [Channa argus]